MTTFFALDRHLVTFLNIDGARYIQLENLRVKFYGLTLAQFIKRYFYISVQVVNQ